MLITKSETKTYESSNKNQRPKPMTENQKPKLSPMENNKFLFSKKKSTNYSVKQTHQEIMSLYICAFFLQKKLICGCSMMHQKCDSKTSSKPNGDMFLT